MQAVEPVATAEVNIGTLSLEQLHHWQLLPEDCVVNGSEASLVAFVDPLLLELLVEEIGRDGGVLLVEGEDVLSSIEVAVIGSDVKQRGAG